MSQLLAARLGAFVARLSRDNIPEDVLETVRCALLHNLSVAAAGSRVAAVGESWAKERGGSGARALVSGVSLAPSDAAFANACLVHARAQDDTFFPGLTHVGAATTPAVLALSERNGATVGDVIAAIVAGYEVAGALGRAGAAVSTARGFRASGIYGPFGAAAGAAHLLGLDETSAGEAIAIASSFSAGTNQTWVGGSSEWQFQLGAAARSGLDAAVLALHGGTGSRDAFEGASGFYAAFAGDASLAHAAGANLGETWSSREVTFKAHPVCAILQGPVDAAIAHHAASAGKKPMRAMLTLSPPELAYPGTDGAPPFRDVGSALMSARFCIAVALHRGAVTSQDLLRSSEAGLETLTRRVELISDPSFGPRQFELSVEWSDGTQSIIPSSPEPAVPWPRELLLQQVGRLQEEVDGIDLRAVAAVVFGDLDSPATALLDSVIAA